MHTEDPPSVPRCMCSTVSLLHGMYVPLYVYSTVFMFRHQKDGSMLHCVFTSVGVGLELGLGLGTVDWS